MPFGLCMKRKHVEVLESRYSCPGLTPNVQILPKPRITECERKLNEVSGFLDEVDLIPGVNNELAALNPIMEATAVPSTQSSHRPPGRHPVLPSFGDLDKLEQLDLNVFKATPSSRSPEPDGGLICCQAQVSFVRNLEGVPPVCDLNSAQAQQVVEKVNQAFHSVLPLSRSSKPLSSGEVSPRVFGSLEELSGDVNPDLHSISEVGKTQNTLLVQQVPGTDRFRSLPQSQATFQPQALSPEVKVLNCCEEGISQSLSWGVEDKGLVVDSVVNRTDHLRITVSSQNGKLGAAFVRGVGMLQMGSSEGLSYAHDAKGGAIVQATDVSQGTGMQIRARLKARMIEKILASTVDDMAHVLGVGDLEIGLTLAPDNKTAGIEVYTKPMKDVTESEMVWRMEEAVRRLAAVERELRLAMRGKDPEIMPVESLEALVVRIMRVKCLGTTYARKYLNSIVINELGEVITPHKGMLSHMVRGNAYSPESLMPRPTDPEAFYVFAAYLDPIVKEMIRQDQVRHPDPPSYVDWPEPNVKPTQVYSYRVRYSRNLEGFGFPAVLKATQFSVIEDRIVKALRKYNDEAGAYYPLSEFRKTEPSLYRQLVKKRLIIPNRLQSRRASGVYRHWPRGRGLYLFAEASDESNLVVQVNSDDHLKVISVDWTGENPERAYTRAVRIMRHLDASGLRFSRHPRYGYVSPCIWSLGSGLRFSGLVKLPGLAKRKKEELERLCNTHMLTIRPGLGIGIPVVNAIYDVGSRCCLGRGEDELIFSVMEGVAALCSNLRKRKT